MHTQPSPSEQRCLAAHGDGAQHKEGPRQPRILKQLRRRPHQHARQAGGERHDGDEEGDRGGLLALRLDDLRYVRVHI